MKKQYVIFLMLITSFSFGQGLTVVEVDKPEIPDILSKLFNHLGDDMEQNIEILEDAFTTIDNPYVKYRINQVLGTYLTQRKEYDKAIMLWKASHDAGLILPFTVSEKTSPGYLSAYKNNKAFKEIIKVNDALKTKASKDTKAEYFVSLPNNYSSDRIYPIIIILHGGVGSYYNTFSFWDSKFLHEKFITVYAQGRDFIGSFSHKYGDYGMDDVKMIYDQVINKYSVDTNSVILAGQSAGGKLAIQLSYESIPAKGLFLAFPVKPKDFDEEKAQVLFEKNISVYMIRGEKDDRYRDRQIELGVLLDSANVNFREVAYPELGHGFPKDFEKQFEMDLKMLK